MRTPLIKFLLASIFLSVISTINAQTPDALHDYIALGMKNNIVLQQKHISLEKAMLSLKIANGLFAPSLNLLGNYTNGDGGRRISFPVGDLLNPVYSTLNQLTGSNQFPQIENVNQNFFPKDFYDVRARVSMPILNTDLLYNRKIREEQTHLQEYEILIYQRELVKNIKVAYFNYLSAQAGTAVYQSALTRAVESKRVNESLLANGKGLPAYVVRAESEIETISAQLADAERQVENAKLYFNFLLNRNPDEAIATNYAVEEYLLHASARLQAPLSVQKREELLQLQTVRTMNENMLNMTKLFWAPRISGFVDRGAQAERMRYNHNANYYLIGVQLDVPLFAGFTNRHKISQSQLEVRNTELSVQHINRQLAMSSQLSRNALVSAYQNYLSAQKQWDAAQSYQRLIEKGYKEGVNTFLEAIDARNQLTQTQLLVTLNQYRVLMAEAGLERETAEFVLE